MAKSKKSKKQKNQHKYLLILSIIFIIMIGLLVFKKPSVTGKVVSGTETIYSDNLNIKASENGTYEWNIKNPGSIKSIKATGSVTSNGTAKVYIENNGTKVLLFDSTKQLFDVNVNVLPDYKSIGQGDEILMQIVLLNLRGFGSGNLNVKYSIKDQKGNLVASQQEITYVETQAKFIRKLLIPPELNPGTYVAFVEASTNSNIVGTGSDTFEVKGKTESNYPPELKNYLIVLAGFMGFIIVAVLANYLVGIRKKKKEIAEFKEKSITDKIEKLEKELKALEEARKAGFISEESYQKEKKRVEDKIGISKK